MSTETSKRRNKAEATKNATPKDGSSLPDNNAASSPSSPDSLRQRKPQQQGKKRPPSKQQRMLMQMKAQQRLEKEQSEVVQAHTDASLSNQLMKLVRTAFLVLLAGASLLWYVKPNLMKRWLRGGKPELPPRSLISIYPDFVNVRRDLPRFFHEYSLATPDNLPTRQAIRHVVALRDMATNPGSKFAQTIHLWPWEVEQFRRQLPNTDALDAYCGRGAEMLFAHRPELRADLVLWCLLSAGHDHGFVRYEVQRVYGSIARGIKGVAVRYDGHPTRAMSKSILLLPFHKPEDLSKGKALPPSTRVATSVMKWLRQNAPLIADVDELTTALEEFLYWVIQKEETAWYWLYAACTAEERQARQDDPRVASMCTKQEEAEGADCCVIFDPHMHEFYERPKAKRRVAKDEEDNE